MGWGGEEKWYDTKNRETMEQLNALSDVFPDDVNGRFSKGSSMAMNFPEGITPPQLEELMENLNAKGLIKAGQEPNFDGTEYTIPFKAIDRGKLAKLQPANKPITAESNEMGATVDAAQLQAKSPTAGRQ